MLPTRDSLHFETHRLKVQELRKLFFQMEPPPQIKRQGQLNLYKRKQTLNQALIKDKKSQYNMIKGSIQQKDIIFINSYAPKYIKQY